MRVWDAVSPSCGTPERGRVCIRHPTGQARGRSDPWSKKMWTTSRCRRTEY